MSLRNLTVGLCMTVVAIAFEAIAVATAMPVAARTRRADLLRLVVLSRHDRDAVLHRRHRPAQRSDRTGQAAARWLGDLRGGAGRGGHRAAYAQLIGGRLIQGLGSGVINTAIFVCVAGVLDPAAAADVHLHLDGVGAAIVRRSTGRRLADLGLQLALGVHRRAAAGRPGRAMVLPTLLIMIRSYRPQEGEPAARPAALWAAGLVAVAAAAIQLAGQRLDWLALALLVAGLAGLLVGLPRLMPPGFLRLGRGLPAVIMVRGLLPGAHFGSEAFIPLMLVEQRKISLLLAGAVLTIGSIGWTTGSWLQSRPWLKIRQDRLITYGCLSVAVGVSIVAVVGIWPGLWFGLVGVGWIFAGLGMGLATSSTSLAVMTLSDVSVQGRNASSLNVFDALGTGIFVGLSGTIFAALRPTGNMSLTFGVVYAAMVGVTLLAVGSSLRIGRVRNEFAR